MKAVNLIPSEERRGKTVVVGRSQGAAYGVVALIAGLAILTLLYGISHHQISSRRAQVASLTAQTQRAQEAATRLTPYTTFATLREQRMQAVSQLVASRFDWPHALHELGRVLPRDASISSLEGTIGATSTPSSSAAPATAAAAATPGSAAAASPVSSATPPGSVPTFTLGGCATSQSEVALTLQRLRLIDGVSNVALQSSTAGSSTASASSASEGACGVGKPTFTIQITFAPLPSPATSASASKITTANGGGQ